MAPAAAAAAAGGSSSPSPPRRHARPSHPSHNNNPCRYRPRMLHLLLLAVGAIYALLLRLGVRTGVLSACTLTGVGCDDDSPSPSTSPSPDGGGGGLALVAPRQPKQQLPTHPFPGERLLFMLSSFDRGERLSGSWEKGKDKMPVILEVVGLARDLCEAGYDVTVAFIAAWPASSQPDSRNQIEARLRCDRLGGRPPPVVWWDHYNASIGGMLVRFGVYVGLGGLGLACGWGLGGGVG